MSRWVRQDETGVTMHDAGWSWFFVTGFVTSIRDKKESAKEKPPDSMGRVLDTESTPMARKSSPEIHGPTIARVPGSPCPLEETSEKHQTSTPCHYTYGNAAQSTMPSG